MCDPSETDEIEEDKSVKQERYEVTGMTCSACSSRVEKCVSKIDGVENVSVNLLTNSMQVSYDENKVNEDIIVSEVEKAVMVLHWQMPEMRNVPAKGKR